MAAVFKKGQMGISTKYFKIGDKVKCIDVSDPYCKCSNIRLGGIYTVVRDTTDSSASNIIVAGIGLVSPTNGQSWWVDENCFELTHPETEEEQLQTLGVRFGYEREG